MSGEWREVELGSVVTLQRGFDLPAQERKPGKVPVVSSSGVSDHHSESRVKAPGVVTGRYGTIGQVFLLKEDYWPLNTTLWVKDFHGNDPTFASYLLRIVDFHSCSDKSSVPGVNRNDVHKIKVALPPLPEQRRIAKILGDLDDKIELNRKMNETLEQMARALFKSWFIDFDPVRAKMEGRQPPGMDADTAALFPSRLVESELGLIPEGWEVKALGDVVECIGGGTPSTKEGLYWNGGTVNWATPKDLSSLQAPLLTATERSITDAGLARVASGLLPARTLLMSSRAPVGYLAISTIPVAINQGFIAMPESSIMPSIYMLHWCNANMTEIQGRASGTTFAELSKSNFRQMRLLLPSGQLLQIFSRMVSDFYNQIETNIHQSRILASLRDTLLPKLMRGGYASANETHRY